MMLLYWQCAPPLTFESPNWESDNCGPVLDQQDAAKRARPKIEWHPVTRGREAPVEPHHDTSSFVRAALLRDRSAPHVVIRIDGRAVRIALTRRRRQHCGVGLRPCRGL